MFYLPTYLPTYLLPTYFGGTGVQIHGLELARQMFYHLSHAPQSWWHIFVCCLFFYIDFFDQIGLNIYK
jgi:hypothetical protein